MTGAMGPGDLVECVNATPSPGWMGPPSRLVVGTFYTVEAVGVIPEGYVEVGEPWVRIIGHMPTSGCFGYHALRFRPISRRGSFEAFLTEIKTPLPDESAEPRERTPERV